MHSSRVRTVRNSSRLLGGEGCLLPGVPAPRRGTCSWGVSVPRGCLLLEVTCSRGVPTSRGVPVLMGMPVPRGYPLPGGACSQGCTCFGGACSGGRGGIPACTEADPPCGQTHRCKNITFATLLRTVNIKGTLCLHFCSM